MHDHFLNPPSYDTTYPREGTETLREFWLKENLVTQLIPARGRKLNGRLPDDSAVIDTTYPREGTET